MEDHHYLESGWCICGHHRDDGRRERTPVDRPTVAEIRAILTAYEPKDAHA